MGYYCSECKEHIDDKEYEYSVSNYGKILCRIHQKEFINKKSYDKHNSEGLSKREYKFKEDIIKGRIAETLIEELFLSLDYDVFRYGMENTIPGVMELLKGIRTEVANDIKRMPDLVVHNKKTYKVYFVEVKFRVSEEFKFSDLPKGYPYENCYFIIVSKKHIKCISYHELKQGKEITPTSYNYLGNCEEFCSGNDKEIIKDFCEFAIKFFDNA